MEGCVFFSSLGFGVVNCFPEVDVLFGQTNWISSFILLAVGVNRSPPSFSAALTCWLLLLGGKKLIYRIHHLFACFVQHSCRVLFNEKVVRWQETKKACLNSTNRRIPNCCWIARKVWQTHRHNSVRIECQSFFFTYLPVRACNILSTVVEWSQCIIM